MAQAGARLSVWVLLGALAAIPGDAAWAQATQSHRERVPQTEGQSPPENLSDRLDRSKGVIQPPPSVDPGMHISPPSPGDRMPVIRPPGSPGGDQTIEPK